MIILDRPETNWYDRFMSNIACRELIFNQRLGEGDNALLLEHASGSIQAKLLISFTSYKIM